MSFLYHYLTCDTEAAFKGGGEQKVIVPTLNFNICQHTTRIKPHSCKARHLFMNGS